MSIFDKLKGFIEFTSEDGAVDKLVRFVAIGFAGLFLFIFAIFAIIKLVGVFF